jgi:3-hydroxybutyryl-CoA dehydratase
MEMALTEKRFSEISLGETIPSLTFRVTQEHINRYAEASGDFNPLHLDEAFAKNTPFKGTIAHGLMTLAFVSQMMTRWNYRRWLFGGELDVKFVGPVRPGDAVTVMGKVVEKDEVNRLVKVELDVKNERGEAVLAGTAQLSFENE